MTGSYDEGRHKAIRSRYSVVFVVGLWAAGGKGGWEGDVAN